MKNLWLSLGLATALLSGASLSAQALPASRLATHARACDAHQLSLSLKDQDGSLAGMSHNGALLMLRNRSSVACQIPALPRLKLENAHRSALDFKQLGPIRWGVGPAMMPVTLQPGAEASGQLRWVSSDTYEANNSIRAKYLLVEVGRKTLRTTFHALMFGAKHQAPELTLDPLRTVTLP